MPAENERLQILEMIDKGQITAAEGIKLLQALQGTSEEAVHDELQGAPTLTPVAQVSEVIPEGASSLVPQERPRDESMGARTERAAPQVGAVKEPEGPPSQPEGAPEPKDLPEASPLPQYNPRIEKWRGWWQIPLWIGVAITILGGLLMYSVWQSTGFSFWFVCSWFPFLLGVAIIALAWSSRTARWLHVRIHQRPGSRPENIAISFPLPIRLGAWFAKTFRRRIPGLEEVSNMDEVIMVLEKTSPEAPFYVEVDEGDGERVEVYIG